MTNMDRLFIALLVALVAVPLWMFTPQQPVPVVNTEIQIDAMQLAQAMAMPLYDRDPNTGQLMGWPENTNVDEGQFIEDCTDVCTLAQVSISALRADGSISTPPRVLYTDFEHLICVCFDGGRVTRYVGWQRR